MMSAMLAVSNPNIMKMHIHNTNAEAFNAMPHMLTSMYACLFMRVPAPLHVHAAAPATDAAGTDQILAFSATATSSMLLPHPLLRAPAAGTGPSIPAQVQGFSEDFHRLARASKGLQGFPWASLVFQGPTEVSNGLHGLERTSQGFQGFPSACKGFPKLSKAFQRLRWSSKAFRSLPLASKGKASDGVHGFPRDPKG